MSRGNAKLEVGQLVLTSTTPPGNLGLYAKDDSTIGVVGQMACVDPTTKVVSDVVTSTVDPITGVSAFFAGGNQLPEQSTLWESIVSSLDKGQDHLLVIIGDSTGDYSDEWPRLLANHMATKTTGRVVFRLLDGTTLLYGVPTVLNAGTEPYCEVGSDARGWGVNYASAGTEGAELDLQVDCALTDWGYGGTEQTFISRSGNTAGRYCWRFFMGAAGTPKLEWSEDGTTLKTAVHPTSYAWGSFAADSRRWVRVTLKCNNGSSGYDVKFYTSPDGVTWTQSGTTVTGAGVTSIFTYATQPIEIGSLGAAAGGSVSGNVNKAAKGKYYAAYAATAIDGANRCPALIRDCNQYPDMVGQRLGGGQLVILNACVAGAGLLWHGDSARAPKSIPIATAAKVIVNCTHNDCQSYYPKSYQANLTALLAYVTGRIDLPEIILASGNPRYSPAAQNTIYTQKTIADLLRKIAKSKNWGYIDIFKAYGSDASLINSDGVHPVAAGSVIAAEYISTQFGICE